MKNHGKIIEKHFSIGLNQFYFIFQSKANKKFHLAYVLRQKKI